MKHTVLTCLARTLLCGFIASSHAIAVEPVAPITQMCVPGDLLFFDDFDPTRVSSRWFFRGDFALRGGALLRTEVNPSDPKRVFLKNPSFHNCIIKFDFKIAGRTTDLRLVTGSGGHYNSVTQIHREHFQVNTPVDREAGHVPSQIGECVRKPLAGQWQTMIVEYWGHEIVAHLNDQEFVLGSHPIIDRTREYFAFQFDLPGASIDNVGVWKAKRQRDGWRSTKPALLDLQRKRSPVARSPRDRFQLESMNVKSRLTLHDEHYRSLVAQHEKLQSQLYQNYPDAFITHKEIGKRISSVRKQRRETHPEFKTLETKVHRASRNEDAYVLSTKPEIADLPKHRQPSELGLARAELESAGDKNLAALVAETRRRQTELESKFPHAFESIDSAVTRRNAIRKALNDDPEFKIRNKAVANALRAIKDYERKVAPKLIELELETKK